VALFSANASTFNAFGTARAVAIKAIALFALITLSALPVLLNIYNADSTINI
jgi:hypothetical protein